MLATDATQDSTLSHNEFALCLRVLLATDDTQDSTLSHNEFALCLRVPL